MLAESIASEASVPDYRDQYQRKGKNLYYSAVSYKHYRRD
jgi:hypothetical protein